MIDLGAEKAFYDYRYPPPDISSSEFHSLDRHALNSFETLVNFEPKDLTVPIACLTYEVVLVLPLEFQEAWVKSAEGMKA